VKSPKEIYLLKKCDMINKFQLFEFVIEGEECQHQVQQNDYVLVTTVGNNDSYF
jgi:hypothetical protein